MTIDNPVEQARNMNIQAVLGLPATGERTKEMEQALDSFQGRKVFGWPPFHKPTEEEALSAATRKFEKDHGLPETGNPSSEATAKLLAAERQKTPQGKELDAFFADSEKNADFMTGAMLGLADAKGNSRVEQIADFQTKHRRKATGILTEEDIIDLGKESTEQISGQIAGAVAKNIPFGLGGILAPLIQKFVAEQLQKFVPGRSVANLKDMDIPHLPQMPITHVGSELKSPQATVVGGGKAPAEPVRGA